MGTAQHDLEENVASEEKTEEPPMYRVYLLNDDYTTMDFVIFVLRQIFNKNDDEAVNIMLNVHRNGIGLCGVYSYEIAETKVRETRGLAQENGFPLQCKIEKEG